MIRISKFGFQVSEYRDVNLHFGFQVFKTWSAENREATLLEYQDERYFTQGGPPNCFIHLLLVTNLVLRCREKSSTPANTPATPGTCKTVKARRWPCLEHFPVRNSFKLFKSFFLGSPVGYLVSRARMEVVDSRPHPRTPQRRPGHMKQ